MRQPLKLRVPYCEGGIGYGPDITDPPVLPWTAAAPAKAIQERAVKVEHAQLLRDRISNYHASADERRCRESANCVTLAFIRATDGRR